MSTTLPPHGRVIVDTTVGEIEIELWAKETPKACRNFIALALEGYYDGVIFHRVVPGFLVQTGDRTGSGAGGESFYGEPFEDEVHPRLRFAHRGIVAMANNGTKNSNDSQFIITLDRAEELHGKHTLFGRVVGDTIYNVMKIGELEIDANERPVYPPKIKRVRIIDNPFDDIIPRITAAEKRAQQQAREKGQLEREEAARRKGAKKNVKLLSFGGDEEATEETEPVAFNKKAIIRPDLIDAPQPTSTIPVPAAAAPTERRSRPSETPQSSTKRADDLDITKIREKHANEQAAGGQSRKTEIEKMETEIRKLTRRQAGDDSDDERATKKAKKSYLDEELSKYTKSKGSHRKGNQRKRGDEDDMMAALSKFQSTLKSRLETEEDEEMAPPGEGEVNPEEDPGIEVDDWDGFLGHKLEFAKDDGEESVKAQRDYEVIDPRVRSAKAKEEEKAAKRGSKQSRLIAKRT